MKALPAGKARRVSRTSKHALETACWVLEMRKQLQNLETDVAFVPLKLRLRLITVLTFRIGPRQRELHWTSNAPHRHRDAQTGSP